MTNGCNGMMCNCGSTAGCPRCIPGNYHSTDIEKYNYSNLPKAQREGWICPKCETSNSPDNETCRGCTPNPVGLVVYGNMTGVAFSDDSVPVSSNVASFESIKDVPWTLTDVNHGG